MSTPTPEVIRKGALVRVAGGPADSGASVLAHAFLDLRFADGHVERWLGSARAGALPDEYGGLKELQRWGAHAADEFAFEIAVDISRAFGGGRAPVVDDLPCQEVVIEWHQDLTG